MLVISNDQETKRNWKLLIEKSFYQSYFQSFSRQQSTLPPLEEHEGDVSYYLESLFTNVLVKETIHHRSNLCEEKVNICLRKINM